MSRCPDARRAEARFDEVLAVVRNIAEVRTLYIADEDPSGNVTCKHGAAECAGNVQQLCAATFGRPRHGANTTNLGWQFLLCQNKHYQDIGSLKLADKCLQAAGFPEYRAHRARTCWSGPEGQKLLRESAAETRRRGVTKSCTVYIGGQYRCTHDDATWYDCPGGSEVQDFVASVCGSFRQLTGRWPEAVCGQQPQQQQQQPQLRAEAATAA